MRADRFVMAPTRRAATLLVGALALCPVLIAGEAAAEPLAIHGAGDFPAPLYKGWFKGYADIDKGVTFSHDAVGSGEGIMRFMAHTVDFAASDKVLTADQATAGMVVLAYNLTGLQKDLKLSRVAYVGIFSGTITRWNDPALDQSGSILAGSRYRTRDAARCERHHRGVCAQPLRRRCRLAGWCGNDGGVAPPQHAGRGQRGGRRPHQDKRGFHWLCRIRFRRRLNLPMAALENRAGQFVAPSAESAKPVSPLRWLILSSFSRRLSIQRRQTPIRSSPTAGSCCTNSIRDAQKRVALQDFVGWGLRKGQELGQPLGYIPPPANVAFAQAQSALRAIE